MTFTMRFEGGAELASALNALPSRLNRSMLTDALKDAGEPMRARMGQLAPRGPDAPHIAQNIGISVATRIGSTEGGRWRAREDQEAAVAVGPTKGYFYGLYWEYGWSRHPTAHPFARPAFDSTAQESLGIIGRAMWTALAARGIGRSITAPSPVQSLGGRL